MPSPFRSRELPGVGGSTGGAPFCGTHSSYVGSSVSHRFTMSSIKASLISESVPGIEVPLIHNLVAPYTSVSCKRLSLFLSTVWTTLALRQTRSDGLPYGQPVLGSIPGSGPGTLGVLVNLTLAVAVSSP